MKSSVESINEVQKRVSVEFPKELVDKAFDKALKKTRAKAQIKGFRKGKVPLGMIRKLYGDSVRYDVAESLINDSLFNVLEENQVVPVAQPVIEDIAAMPNEGQEFGYSALVDILPPIEIKGYKGLELSYHVHPVDEAAVEESLAYTRRRFGDLKNREPDDPICPNDYVTISHEVFDGETQIEALTTEKMPVELGTGTLLEDLEKAIVGMRAGEDKTVQVDLPKSYQDRELAGKTVTFKVTVDTVQQLVLPSLDDELAKDAGFKDLDDMRATVKRRLEKDVERHKREQLESGILSQLSKINTFEVPPSLIDLTIDDMIKGLNWPTENEKKEALNDSAFRDKFKDEAKSRVRNTLILEKIMETENIEVTDEDVEAHLDELLQGAAAGMGENAEIMGKLRENIKQTQNRSLQIRKTIDFIISQSNVKEDKAHNHD